MGHNEFDLEEDVDISIDIPKKYKVIIHNDNYTPFDFVIKILIQLFNKNNSESEAIATNVHKKGKDIVGTYPKNIAKTKTNKANELAKANGFPLKLTVEEE